MSLVDDPEAFRAAGHRVIDLLADHLRAAGNREGPVSAFSEPEAMSAAWPAAFPSDPATGDDLPQLLARAVAQSIHLHHPRYVGHQVTAPLGEAALCDLVSSLLNNGMAVYEMGAVSSAMERSIVRWMATALGFPQDADGVLTSGGSAGNLTALLAARQAKAGWDAWGEGAAAGPPLAVLVGETAHYSISRAVQIMGWGRGGAVPVPVDARFRLRVDALPAALAAAEAAGRRVIGVVASAGSTATGAYDPLPAIADFCAARGLWLHVDGAHGASAAIAPRHRHLLAGIDRADSVVWDAHKMLLMPALVTGVVFRDGARSYESFAQQASYLYPEEAAGRRWWDIGLRTLECTKRMMSLGLYATLALRGTAALGAYVDDMYDLAARFAARMASAGDFEVIPPDANIVCFRVAGAGDDVQLRAREAILKDGGFYLVKTKLAGKIWLRTTIVNPRTTDADLDALLDAIRRSAA